MSAIIDSGCEFEGKLSFQGTVRIAGNFKGSILASDILIIGKGAHVKASIEVKVAMIHGEVVGDILAHERVEVYSPAIIRGNIKTPSLFIEEGVVFEGSTKMEKTDSKKLLPLDMKPKQTLLSN
ncbi:MAG: polymer-forming cytoskeletal protein [Deltaproteobacteria bacterium]|nr:polymer-forming cytoskeletal protein [Deltaproteobacteria bacterium]